MSYTSHGHHIQGTISLRRPSQVSRCGGPGICELCTQEAAFVQKGIHLDPIQTEPAPEKITDMVFDAILNSRMKPLFHGPREKVLQWLTDNPAIANAEGITVCVSRTVQIMSVQGFYQEFSTADEKKIIPPNKEEESDLIRKGLIPQFLGSTKKVWKS